MHIYQGLFSLRREKLLASNSYRQYSNFIEKINLFKNLTQDCSYCVQSNPLSRLHLELFPFIQHLTDNWFRETDKKYLAFYQIIKILNILPQYVGGGRGCIFVRKYFWAKIYKFYMKLSMMFIEFSLNSCFIENCKYVILKLHVKSQ